MEFIGEHLIPGKLGHFFVLLSFISSLIGAIAYYKSTRSVFESEDSKYWTKLARFLFAFQTIAILGIFITLYYIISHHLFEYKYAWQHSSRALPMEYLLSCFWEGQEGSFMLWSFWNAVIGWVLISRKGKWEAPVMTIMNLVQIVISSMLLGLVVFGHKFGSNPFVLLRNEMDAPIFSTPNYLDFIKDGNGLNASLQNYWMVIHPPVLFLGFASTLVPFAFALASFLRRDYHNWAAPVLPWALFAVATLGTGIMMGGAWAYESLTFGGYWAWDPVENASLVPWLVLIAGIHTNIVYKNSGYSLKSTYFFYIIAFCLIVYSTFLTRSGVLGDTSVHSFTDLGMNVQLFLFLSFVIWLPNIIHAKGLTNKLIIGFIYLALCILTYKFAIVSFATIVGGMVFTAVQLSRNKDIPHIAKEENLYSREFWIYIASLVFFLSGIVIIAKTSLPVFNQLFNTSIAPPEDIEFSYNQIQIWVAIVVGFLTAVAQYLRYKDTPVKSVLKKLLIPTLVTLGLYLLFVLTIGIKYYKKGLGFEIAIHAALFMGIYAVIANLLYIFSGLKGNLKLSGASIAHVGFGLVLVGILISSANKETISINTTGISPLKMKDDNDANNNPAENTTLIKGISTDMKKYMVTYVKDTVNPRDGKRYYEIDFVSKDSSERFKLYPNLIENNKGGEGLMPNPDAKHYLSHDVFGYVTFLSDPNVKDKDTTTFRNKTIKIGDTTFYSNGMWVVNSLELNPPDSRFEAFRKDTVLAADITVISKDGRFYKSRPAFKLEGNQINMLPDTVMSQSLVFALIKPGDLEKKEVEIGIKESNAILDFITLKVYSFPGINILWFGIIVMVIGTFIAIVHRVKLLKRTAKQ
ncbi:cytochrome c biogenesis protein CcsA [Polluticaenibacter yanchengensis]|uniref:Cytochrome c biogenesis protein CcsA n=1 Tax=Polluticaenibacter yanchengensis TaxID=3014562 RepID=A0ABT4UPX2_9BACT|nr:cytochrome c biogenesis protein CcsA [Chitinophagaceae bacterium LY-5]